MIQQTKGTQLVDGVQFERMGQQNNLGRYPVHIHLNQHLSTIIVRKNSVVYSRQRCIVIHGTKNALIEGNVVFEGTGHCFMQEDGYEELITVKDNLIINVRPPKFLLGNDLWTDSENREWLIEDETSSHENSWWVNGDPPMDKRIRQMNGGTCTPSNKH